MDMDMDTDETPAAPARKPQPAVEEEEPEEEIKVVSDYQPRVAAPTAKRPATVIDPVSGKAVPVDQIGGTRHVIPDVAVSLPFAFVRDR